MNDTIKTTIEPVIKEGDKVLYILEYGERKGDIRPAFVVRRWSNTCANLIVFTDCTNDLPCSNGIYWATSRSYDKDKKPGSWHIPE